MNDDATILEKRIPTALFASLLSAYPDDNFMTQVGSLLNDTDLVEFCSSVFPEEWAALEKHLVFLFENTEELENLRSDFIDIFERGRESNPLYETEYGRARALVKGNDLTDIAGFYKAFGFTLGTDDDAPRDMVDHISIELEFYALLLMKEYALLEDKNQEGVEIVADARSKFLKDHIGRFVGTLKGRPGVVSHPFYRDTFEFVHAFLNEECSRMNVIPDPIEWIDSKLESETMGCGSLKCLSDFEKDILEKSI